MYINVYHQKKEKEKTLASNHDVVQYIEQGIEVQVSKGTTIL